MVGKCSVNILQYNKGLTGSKRKWSSYRCHGNFSPVFRHL